MAESSDLAPEPDHPTRKPLHQVSKDKSKQHYLRLESQFPVTIRAIIREVIASPYFPPLSVPTSQTRCQTTIGISRSRGEIRLTVQDHGTAQGFGGMIHA